MISVSTESLIAHPEHFGNLNPHHNQEFIAKVSRQGLSSATHTKMLASNPALKCQTCHPDIYETYTQSVHGAALLSEHNQDVPICSDCHSAHHIKDPTLSDFRNNVPEMCGNCHANTTLMKKYGLSTNILVSVSTLIAGMVRGHHKRDIFLPILVFPLLLPLALGVVRWVAAMQNSEGLWEAPWGHLLVGFDIIFTSAAWMLFPVVLDE